MTINEAAKYYAVPTYYPAAVPSYYVDPNYYSEVPFTSPNSTLPPVATLKLLFTATPRHPSITPLLRFLRPTVPKLRSIPLPRATIPLRNSNVTSQPSLLQFSTGRLLHTRSENSDLFICVKFFRSYLDS
jgi:hypothetical protein